MTRDRWYTLGGTTRPGPVPRARYGRARTVFFLVGAAVLLRARMRDIVVCAAVCTGLFLLAR